MTVTVGRRAAGRRAAGTVTPAAGSRATAAGGPITGITDSDRNTTVLQTSLRSESPWHARIRPVRRRGRGPGAATRGPGPRRGRLAPATLSLVTVRTILISLTPGSAAA